ncbi:MAG: hypothetical protein IJT25_00500 [Clostridia bacterium]|nr:hypothetical protein [Clostridia bacterium]
MILKDKNKDDVTYEDLKELARDIVCAEKILEIDNLSSKNKKIAQTAIEKKNKEILYYVDKASLKHKGDGKFYPYGFSTLVDEVEDDYYKSARYPKNTNSVMYDTYKVLTDYELELNSWWKLKNIIFDYGIKHGYLIVAPKERLNKSILATIKADFGCKKNLSLKIVGRDFSEEELDKYLEENRQMSR